MSFHYLPPAPALPAFRTPFSGAQSLIFSVISAFAWGDFIPTRVLLLPKHSSLNFDFHLTSARANLVASGTPLPPHPNASQMCHDQN